MTRNHGKRLRNTWLWMSIAWLPCLLFAAAGSAQGTKQWTVDRFDELQRGTADAVAIRSDGRLEAGLAANTLYTAQQSYIWSVACAPDGSVIAGVGGSSGGAAAVIHVRANGESQTLFSGKEMGVQAVKVNAEGAVFAATSPDGKVYRLGAKAGSEHIVFDPADTAERSKYIWDLAVGRDGSVYVATGAPAAVYRVAPSASGKPELLFHTADAHIRSLLLTRAGMLWAGSDGAGVVYRFDTTKKQEQPFAAYASAHREITALATDDRGDVYAAAVGSKSGASSLPPFPVTGATGVTVTFLQPSSTSAAGSNTVVPEGSEIDRIAADGTPMRLAQLKESVVYGLAVENGQVLAATGNRGRIFRVDPALAGQVTELARVNAGQATAIAAGPRGLVVGTSNGGKVALLDPPTSPTYLSEVFDAGQYARWGRVEIEADAPGAAMFLRTGNVPSPVEGWSAWRPVSLNGATANVPAGRYAQWKAELKTGRIASVTLNYLPRNVAPVVDEVVVAPGARITASQAAPSTPTVQVVFPSAGAAAQAISYLQQDSVTGPLTAQKDKNGIVIRWSAHDDNGDDLMFSVLYRGEGEQTWRLLKDKLSDRYLSLDASLLPDGRYEAKVVASDAPEHTDADTLSGERQSSAFTVDTTPPIPGALTARLEGSAVHWTFEAHDATTPIAHAEYSLDAGPWQYVEPVGGLSDSLAERYDARSPLPSPPDAAGAKATPEHSLAVRVYDRADNMTSVKTVVR